MNKWRTNLRFMAAEPDPGGTAGTIDKEEDAKLMEAMAGGPPAPPEVPPAEPPAAPSSETETAQTPPPPAAGTETPPAEAPPAAPTAPEPPAAPTPPPANAPLDAEALRSVLERMPAAVGEAVKAATTPPPAPAKPKEFKPWRPTKEMYKKMFESEEDGIEVIGQVADAATLQALQIMTEQVLPQYNEQIKTLQGHIVAQEQAANRAEFVRRYPQFEPFIDSCAEYFNKLQAAGKIPQNATRDDVFKMVADGMGPVVAQYDTQVQEYKKRVNPKPVAGGGQSVAPPSLPGGSAVPKGNGSTPTKAAKSEDEELMEMMEKRRR